MERSFVEIPECPTNLTAADAINHVPGRGCGCLDELATSTFHPATAPRLTAARTGEHALTIQSFCWNLRALCWRTRQDP